MPAKGPHYLLFSEAESPSPDLGAAAGSRWRFVLEAIADGRRQMVEDVEPHTTASRLELLAVVRGLEALDGPSRVTLVTRSRYVSQGFRRGLSEWRRHDWCWERFGRRVPIRDHDLWRRVDRALRFHEVDCRAWRFTSEDAAAPIADDPGRAPSALTDCRQEVPAVAMSASRKTANSSPPRGSAHAAEAGPAVVIVPKPRRRRRTRFAGIHEGVSEMRRRIIVALYAAGQFFAPNLVRV